MDFQYMLKSQCLGHWTSAWPGLSHLLQVQPEYAARVPPSRLDLRWALPKKMILQQLLQQHVTSVAASRHSGWTPRPGSEL